MKVVESRSDKLEKTIKEFGIPIYKKKHNNNEDKKLRQDITTKQDALIFCLILCIDDGCHAKVNNT